MGDKRLQQEKEENHRSAALDEWTISDEKGHGLPAEVSEDSSEENDFDKSDSEELADEVQQSAEEKEREEEQRKIEEERERAEKEEEERKLEELRRQQQAEEEERQRQQAKEENDR